MRTRGAREAGEILTRLHDTGRENERRRALAKLSAWGASTAKQVWPPEKPGSYLVAVLRGRRAEGAARA